MNENALYVRKNNLQEFINLCAKDKILSANDRLSLVHLSSLLNKYNYKNRLEMKGLLTRKIIDSLDTDYTLAEKFINFDNSII